MDPATKDDVKELRQSTKDGLKDLRQWLLEREVASIRWFVGTQLAYVVITLGAMYFMLAHLAQN